MRKKIVSIALVAMSLVAFNGMAQSSNKGDNGIKTENVKGNRPDKKGDRPERNPYEGLKLTDAQKNQLQQLDNKRKEARKQQMENSQEKKQQDKTAAMEARKAAKKEYLEQVKAIVGPDQYVVFLENMYINGGQPGGKAFKQGPRDGKQGFAHNQGKKGNRQRDGKRSGQGQRGNSRQSGSSRS